MPNTSSNDRGGVILTYTPSGHKHSVGCDCWVDYLTDWLDYRRTHRQLGMVVDAARILDADGKLSRPSLRRVLGLVTPETEMPFLPSERSAHVDEQRLSAPANETV